MSASTRYRRPAQHGSAPVREGSAPVPRQPVGPMPWVMAGAVFAGVIGCALGLDGVLRGWAWLFSAAITVGAVLLVTAAARAMRLPEPLVPVLGIAALGAMLTLQFFSSTAFLGLVPTKATLDELGPLLRVTSDTVIGGVAPVEPLDGILLVICAGLGLVALLADSLAVSLTMPASSGLGLLAVLLVPALVTPDSVGALGFVAGSAGYLLILGCSQWFAPHGQARPAGTRTGGQLRRAAGIGGAAVVVTLLLPLAIPGFNSGTFPEGSHFNPFGKVSGLNPMITLGNDLRNPSAVGQMTYATDSATPVYLRSATLEDFQGDSWEPSSRPDERRLDPSRINDDFSTAAVINGILTTTRIDSQDFSSPWLPVPYAPLSVRGLLGRWTWDPETLTIAALDSNTLHQTYVVRSVMPQLTRATLEQVVSPPRPALDPQFLALPKNTPDIIKSTALSVTGRAPTPYDKAIALQDFLRGPEFTYSEQTPLKEGYDGSGMDVVAKFLQVKSGYCVHFAAAMAVMAREAGIPSRIAVGYAPGRLTGKKVTVGGRQLTEYSVDGHNAHAWPELYFEGLGWVPFEPTPTRGQVPAYALTASVPGLNAGNPGDSLLPSGTASGSASPAPAGGPLSGPGASASGQNGAVARTFWLVAAGALALLVLASPYLSRTGLRRRRLAVLRAPASALPAGPADRSRPPRGSTPPAAVAWAELQDLVCDYGLDPVPSDTPRTFADRVLRSPLVAGGADGGGAVGDSAGATGRTGVPQSVERLLARYERSTYGPPAGTAAWSTMKVAAETAGDHLQDHDAGAELSAIQTSLKRQSTALRRLRAELLPPSTLRRWKGWWDARLDRPARSVARLNPAPPLRRLGHRLRPRNED
ncbi:MAG TPA: transglutaminaseTgpA domain-containing protein [Micrococcaceae bacterium]